MFRWIINTCSGVQDRSTDHALGPGCSHGGLLIS